MLAWEKDKADDSEECDKDEEWKGDDDWHRYEVRYLHGFLFTGKKRSNKAKDKITHKAKTNSEKDRREKERKNISGQDCEELGSEWHIVRVISLFLPPLRGAIKAD